MMNEVNYRSEKVRIHESAVVVVREVVVVAEYEEDALIFSFSRREDVRSRRVIVRSFREDDARVRTPRVGLETLGGVRPARGTEQSIEDGGHDTT